MGDVIEFPEPNYFGDCPKCGRNDGYINIGRGHWFVCDRHKTKWYIGSNLFSCWKDETEEMWLRNADELANYQEVKPWHRGNFRQEVGDELPLPDVAHERLNDDLPF